MLIVGPVGVSISYVRVDDTQESLQFLDSTWLESDNMHACWVDPSRLLLFG